MGFCLVGVFLCVNALVSLDAALKLTDTRERIALTHETIEELQNLAGLVKNADMEARAYLLTGESHFLGPYRQAVEETGYRLDVLERLLVRDPDSEIRLSELRDLISQKTSDIEELIWIKEAGGRQAAVATMAEGGGHLSVAPIRRAIADMTRTERSLLTLREIEAARATRLAVATFAAVNISALVMLVAAYALAVAYLRRRRESREQLERAYGELEVRVQERTEELAQANRKLHDEIEERRRAQAELKREHGLLQLILDSIGDGVVVADTRGGMILFNPAGRRILGLGSAERIQDQGRIVQGMYQPGTDAPVVPDQLPLARAARGESFDDTEYRVRNEIIPQGVDVSATGRPLVDEHGEVLGGVVIFRDVTQRNRMAAEREELLRKMMEALAQVKTLSGLLPICAGCKSIRDDKGYWRRLEAYISEHSQAEFSHGLCPKCAAQLYPETFPSRADKTAG